MHVGVDFDDVLYPYHYYLKRRILNRFGIDLTTRRVTTFFYNQLPEFRERGISREDVWDEVMATWHQVEDHQEAVLLDPDAPDVLRRLGRQHEVILITARSEDTLPNVRLFLERQGIVPDQVRMGCTEKTGFDVLVDDFPKHALENAQHGGRSLLYTIDENSDFDVEPHENVHRVHNWQEVATAIARWERDGA